MRPAFPDPQLFLARADRADAWNRLQAFFGMRLPLAGGRAALTVTPSEAPPAGLPRSALSAGGIEATVAFADFPFQALVGIPLQASDLADLAPALRDALISGMVETVAAALPEPFRSVRAGQASAAPADLGWAVLTFEGLAQEPVTVFVGASRSAVAGAFTDLPPSAPGRGPLLASTPVVATVTLLRIAVPRSEIRALAPGRMLVLDREAEHRSALRVNDHVWDLARTDGGWQVTRIGRADAVVIAVDQGENTMADTSDGAGEGSAALMLPIDFDIGSATVSLGDLDGWRVGSVLALDLPRPDEALAVTIRVGGTPVGTGDLVRIEDRLAVRITALWGAKA